MAGALLRTGWSKDDVRRIVKAVVTAVGDEELQDRLTVVETTAYKLAMKQECEGWPSLADWLKDDADAAYKIAGTKQNETEPVDWGERALELTLSIKDWKSRELPPPRWLIDEFLHAETNNILFGAQKTGKSYALLWLAIRVAVGKAYFNWHVSKAAKVLYIDCELPAVDLKNRISKLIPEDTENLHLLSLKDWRKDPKAPPINLNSKDGREILDYVIEKLMPDLLILDNAFGLVLGINKQSDEDWEPTMEWLQNWNGRGLTTLLVCHVAKGKEADSAFGSVVQMAKANTIKLSKGDASGQMILTPWESNHMATNKKVGTIIEQVHEDDKIVLKYVGEEEDQKKDTVKVAIIHRLADGFKGTQVNLAKTIDKDPGWVSKKIKDCRGAQLIHPKKLELTKAGKEFAQATGWYSGCTKDTQASDL